MGIIAIESGGNASVHLQLTKASLNHVPLGVEFPVVPDLSFAIPFSRYDRFDLLSSYLAADLVGVVAFVGNHAFGLLVLQEFCRALAISLLSSGQDHPQRASELIAQHVYLGGQSSSGSPHSLLGRPLFPVAACWWALTSEESIIT